MKERGQGSPDQKPTSVSGKASPGIPESTERQPLPNVWDTLERRVRLEARWQAGEFSSVMEYESEYRKVGTFDEKTWKKLTSRERLIADFYSTLSFHYSILRPDQADPFSKEKALKELTPEQFQQFRSKVKPISEDEIREEYHKARESLQADRRWQLVMP